LGVPAVSPGENFAGNLFNADGTGFADYPVTVNFGESWVILLNEHIDG
jgi:hypothetical protein